MGVLQDEFDRLIAESFSAHSTKSDVLVRVFAKRGIALTSSQLQSVIAALDEATTDDIELTIDGVHDDIRLSSGELEKALEECRSHQDACVEQAVMAAMKEMSPSILKSLFASLPRELRHRQSQQRAFESRLHKRWKRGLDRLAMLIIMAHEGGETHAHDLQS